MKYEWIIPFEKNKRKLINLSSNTSISRSMKVALKFATDNLKPDNTPVLFVFVIINYRGINGLMMNNEAFTAYPSEGELLLAEGCSVYVHEVERGYKIEN